MKIKNLWLFDENKILILFYLYKNKDDICGKDLVNFLDIPKNLLSYHISILREKNFLKEKRCGKRKVYTIDGRKIEYVKKVLEILSLK